MFPRFQLSIFQHCSDNGLTPTRTVTETWGQFFQEILQSSLTKISFKILIVGWHRVTPFSEWYFEHGLYCKLNKKWVCTAEHTLPCTWFITCIMICACDTHTYMYVYILISILIGLQKYIMILVWSRKCYRLMIINSLRSSDAYMRL